MKTTFSYRAYNHQGQEVQGEVEAIHQKDAFDQIRKLHYFPIAIEPQVKHQKPKKIKKEKPTFLLGTISTDELARFTANFAMLYKSSIPLAMGLKMLKEQQKTGHIKNALILAIPEIESGNPISEAFAKSPKTFDAVYLNSLRAGEAGGQMIEILTQLGKNLEKQHALHSKLKEALIYPVVTLILGLVIFAFLLGYAVPMINQFMRSLSGPSKLPWLTQMLFDLAEGGKTYWYLWISIPLGIWIFYVLARLFSKGKQIFDFLKLKLPFFGKFYYQHQMSNFLRTLGLLLQSSVSLDSALLTLQKTTTNSYLQKCFQKIHLQIVAGFPLDFAFREQKIFDEMTINMMTLGEQTGNLKELLLSLSTHFETEVELFLQKWLKMLTPTLIIILGIFVLIFGLAFMLPIFQLYQGLGAY